MPCFRAFGPLASKAGGLITSRAAAVVGLGGVEGLYAEPLTAVDSGVNRGFHEEDILSLGWLVIPVAELWLVACSSTPTQGTVMKKGFPEPTPDCEACNPGYSPRAESATLSCQPRVEPRLGRGRFGLKTAGSESGCWRWY